MSKSKKKAPIPATTLPAHTEPDHGLYDGMFEVERCSGDGIEYFAIRFIDSMTQDTLASASMRADQFANALAGRAQGCKLRVEDGNIAKWERHPARVWKATPKDVEGSLVQLQMACQERRDVARTLGERAEWARLAGLLGKATLEAQGE